MADKLVDKKLGGIAANDSEEFALRAGFWNATVAKRNKISHSIYRLWISKRKCQKDFEISGFQSVDNRRGC
jgi:hypothetical protein